MVYCQNCGAENEDSAGFCKECGTRIGNKNEISEISMKINWKLVIIGSIFTVILVNVVTLLSGINLTAGFSMYLISGAIIGYAAGKHYLNGIINLLLICFIIIVFTILMTIFREYATLVNLTQNESALYMVGMTAGLVLASILILIGGVIGITINRTMNK